MSRAGPLDLPVLLGEHVRLRAFAPSDVAAVLEAATDPCITGVTSVPAVVEPTAAASSVARQRDRARTGEGWSFAIAGPGDVAVGQIGLWPRDADRGRAGIGYWVIPSARRRGHALDALRTLTAWAERLPGLGRLELVVKPWNEPSWRTAERAGYQREGLLRSWQRIGDRRRDVLMHSRLPPSRHAAAACP